MCPVSSTQWVLPRVGSLTARLPNRLRWHALACRCNIARTSSPTGELSRKAAFQNSRRAEKKRGAGVLFRLGLNRVRVNLQTHSPFCCGDNEWHGLITTGQWPFSFWLCSLSSRVERVEVDSSSYCTLGDCFIYFLSSVDRYWLSLLIFRIWFRWPPGSLD